MYRKTDPSTSRWAAEEMIYSGKLGERQAQVLELVHKYPGRTHGELAALMYKEHRNLGILCCAESPHKRLPELETKNLVACSWSRTCKETRKEARTWYPIEYKEGPHQKILFGD